jgi:hypothetical protein
MSELPDFQKPDRERLIPQRQEQLDRMRAGLRRLGCRWWCTCLVTCTFFVSGLGMMLVYWVLPQFRIIAPPWVKYLTGGAVLASSVPLIMLSFLIPKTGKAR